MHRFQVSSAEPSNGGVLARLQCPWHFKANGHKPNHSPHPMAASKQEPELLHSPDSLQHNHHREEGGTPRAHHEDLANRLEVANTGRGVHRPDSDGYLKSHPSSMREEGLVRGGYGGSLERKAKARSSSRRAKPT
ncbi:hypothetical protein FRX31_023744 [Thalictrum thalictroides]|uniref:Uncharacterized protein n=1 Tax=Thalictrum thalictroides TaxID=46969 RepID=A0A7J6VNI7_THATH|nr:hypothetical protein FRX31_023744 [Thalictrum thalictroides]